MSNNGTNEGYTTFMSTPNSYLGTTNETYIELNQLLATAQNAVSTTEISVNKNGKRPTERGIMPQLYFSYVKKKFGTLEAMRLDSRIKKVEKAWEEAVSNGQYALAEKMLRWVMKETRESVLYAKGIRHFIEKDDLDKHKRNIRGGHISDTRYKEYTRVIPPEVVAKKKKVEDVFDEFIIYHYWNPAAVDTKQMAPEEKSKMRDPILFGIIKETNRMYFIADWEDEFCTLTFDEVIDHLGKKDEELTLTNRPEPIA